MSFGGGNSGGGAITVHKHNSQTGEGGPLEMKNSIVDGTSMQVENGTEVPLEVVM